MEWTREQALMLIELYHNHPVLWDASHKDYKNKLKKINAWKNVAEALELDRAEVEKKMKILISQLQREVRKLKRKFANGEDNMYTSSWFAFSNMSFLLKRNKQRPSCDAATEAGWRPCRSIVEHKRQLALSAEMKANEASTSAAVGAAECVEDGARDAWDKEDERHVFSAGGTGSAGPSIRKTAHHDFKKRHEAVTQEACQVMKSLSQQCDRVDEYYHYGNLVACKLRKLNTHYAKSTVQNLIQNILYSAEQGHYDYPSGNHPQ